jgi:hypothetical protein
LKNTYFYHIIYIYSADLPSAKFLIGMMLLIVLIFAGGTGVLEVRKGTAFAGEMSHFGGGNISFDGRKWCIWVGEIVDLRKKILFRSVMGCRLVP